MDSEGLRSSGLLPPSCQNALDPTGVHAYNILPRRRRTVQAAWASVKLLGRGWTLEEH